MQRWLVDRERNRVREGEAGTSQWDAIGKRAIALLRLHALRERQLQFVRREDVVASWHARVAAVRSAFQGLPARVAVQLAQRAGTGAPECAKVAAELAELVDDVLATFCEDGPFTPASPIVAVVPPPPAPEVASATAVASPSAMLVEDDLNVQADDEELEGEDAAAELDGDDDLELELGGATGGGLLLVLVLVLVAVALGARAWAW